MAAVCVFPCSTVKETETETANCIRAKLQRPTFRQCIFAEAAERKGIMGWGGCNGWDGWGWDGDGSWGW